MIQEAIIKSLETSRKRWPKRGRPKLWVSEVGRCPRRAMLRVKGVEPSVGFPTDVLNVMDLGKSFEDNTGAHLERVYGNKVVREVPLGNEIWSGRADFVFLYSNLPVVVEHKATGGKWFNYNNNLPKVDHVCQLCMYGYLYHYRHAVIPKLILFYRAWRHYAEFELIVHDDGVRALGIIDDEPASIWLWTQPKRLRLELEDLWRKDELPPLPNGPSDEVGCTFCGERSCGYYDECWGKA